MNEPGWHCDGRTESQAYLAAPLFVGAGLMTEGIIDFCGMARVLVHMPWNRAVYRP